MIRSSILEPKFNMDRKTFPCIVNSLLKGIALTVCHFECEEHLQKYLDRYKLKSKDYQVSNRDGKSLKSSQKHKTNVPKRSRNSDNKYKYSSQKKIQHGFHWKHY